ncbi:hypothetical protein ACXWOF_09915, partial [Streptococcus pyogenes]
SHLFPSFLLEKKKHIKYPDPPSFQHQQNFFFQLGGKKKKKKQKKKIFFEGIPFFLFLKKILVCFLKKKIFPFFKKKLKNKIV